MPIYATVFDALQQDSIPFLVIGGHAVVLHGHQRNTFDLDLLISELSLPLTKSVLERLGYTPYFESGAFLQLTPRTGLPPLDLMIVDESTFTRLSHFTEIRVFDGWTIRIPDPKRLVAMKLHALKAASRLNREKDWNDIVGIIKASNLRIEDREFQEIVQQYGSPGAIEEIKRRL
jgi:predicted nucleotidyltransferase